MQSTTAPRQFRVAGPMILKNSSSASLEELRQVTTRYSDHIKYIALYKQAGTTMLLAQAHEKLSVMQWRSFLGVGVKAIMHNTDMKAAIITAKQQEGFEEHVSTKGRAGKKGSRTIQFTHVDASLEQMVHVQLLSPVKEPVHKKQKKVQQQQEEPVPTKKNDNPSKRIVEKYAKLREQYPKVSVWQPYLVARASYFKTQEEIKHQKTLPPKPPADLSLADYHPPTSAARTSLNGKDIMQQGRLHAYEAYLKANEDYSLGRMPQRISMRSTFEKQE